MSVFKYTGTATNDEDFVESFEIPTTGADITDWAIEFIVGGQLATVTKEVLTTTSSQTAKFKVVLPLATMQGFCPGSYPVGCRYTLDGITSQILVGALNIAEGNFTL